MLALGAQLLELLILWQRRKGDMTWDALFVLLQVFDFRL